MTDNNLPHEIPLAGASNFRDLGGYTAGPGSVRFGAVYRSGRLPGLTDGDLRVVEDLGIRTVVTLLNDDDVAEYGPDRLPAGARSVALPIDSPTATDLAERARSALSSGDFSTIPPELNLRIHRLLVSDGRERYGELLRLIADPDNRPLVFHCSHGVHRTGTAAALLLALLGVDWAAVRHDYLASNRCRQPEVAEQLDRMRTGVAQQQGIPDDEVDMTNMEAFMIQDGSYIDATRDQVQHDYSSFERYARDGLGCSDDLIRSLQDQLIDRSA
jgi:protein-tyrosine phosphatase